MKRIIAICLVFVMAFSFVGCKSGEKKEEGYSIDIQYYISVGQIKEAEFSLGTSIEDIEKVVRAQSAEEHSADGHDEHIVLVEGSDYNYYNAPDFYYYYNVGNEEKGISCIVGFTDIYGFSVGQTGEYEVKTALELEKLSPVSGIAEEEEFFFMPFSLENCKKLTCTYKNNVLKFYFENDVLIAGVIYNKDNWTV